jgi:hypothetical protein
MVLSTLATLVQSDPMAASGASIAAGLQDFVAPIAAVLIGAVGLKYLFGENKSLAAFIGFVFLGAFVYSLIKWGDSILGALGGVVQSILT